MENTSTTRIDLSTMKSPFLYLMDEDKQGRYKDREIQDGVMHAKEGLEMHVGVSGFYWFKDPTGSRIIETYARIGYHTMAEQILAGFLSAGGVCFFHGFKGIVGQVSL